MFVKAMDELVKNPPLYADVQPCGGTCTCDRAKNQCVNCDTPLILSVLSWWDKGFNSLFDCTRSEIRIQIPRSIVDGVAKDTQVWDEELEMYVYGGTVQQRNEPSISVAVEATVGSGWFLPLDSDIEVQGMTGSCGHARINMYANLSHAWFKQMW